jgi:hypothetical protein
MRRPMIALALAALLAAGSGLALSSLPSAQAAAEPAAAATHESPRAGERGMRHGRRGGAFAARAAGPVQSTIRDLRALERLYYIDGRGKDVEGLYRDVLAKTQNPAVRQFAYGRIARNELRPASTGEAIATLRQSLDENLKRLPQQ